MARLQQGLKCPACVHAGSARIVGCCLAFKFDLKRPRIGRSLGSSLPFLGAILGACLDLPRDQVQHSTLCCDHISVQRIQSSHRHIKCITEAAMATCCSRSNLQVGCT